MVVNNLRENEEKWDILRRFWVENLACAATLCQGNNHAQQLPKGGEFLTHVWFLIEHLNLQEIFRIPPRARVFRCYNLMGRDGPEPMIRPLWVAGPIWLCDKNNYP